MTHPEHQRRAYLRALGIDVWVPRDADEPAADEPAADEVAAAQLDWAGLREAVAACTRCELAQSRTNTVFGVGNEAADWMIIGEAPGAEEDRQGEPFVGRAGKLLDQMLFAIGESRDSVFIANILKCRPPGNRNPAVEEAAACQPYLQRQIALVRPKLILSVGAVSAHNLLGTDEAVGRLRRRLHRIGPDDTPVLVSYHPAYLLRNPATKREAWADLLSLQARLRGGA